MKNNTFMTDTYGLINPIYYSRIANPYFTPFYEQGNYLYDYDVVRSNETDEKQGFNIFEERANTNKESVTQPSILSLMFSYVLTISGKFIHRLVCNGINCRKKNMPG